MQVAVTLANQTGLTSLFEDLCMAFEFATSVVSHPIRRRCIQTSLAEFCESRGAPLDDPGHAGLAPVGGAMFGGAVEFSDRRSEWRHELQSESACRCEAIEQ